MKRITTSRSIYFKLKNKKYAIVPKKEFIIPEYLNIYKKRFKKNWGKLEGAFGIGGSGISISCLNPGKL